MRRRHTIVATLVAGLALVASPGGAAPAETSIDSLTVEADGLTVSVSGTATLGGDEAVVGTDALNDNVGGAATAPLGLDLVSATIGQPDPTRPELAFTLKLNGMTGGGIPEFVSYNWNIRVDGTVWRLTAMRTRALVMQSADPYAALFTCTAGAGGTQTCSQNKLLPVTFGADDTITITLPMADVGATPGSVIEPGATPPIGISGTAFGSASLSNLYDTMVHDPYTVPSSSAGIGLAPAGSTPSFTTGVPLSGGSFAGSITAPAPGEYVAGARALSLCQVLRMDGSVVAVEGIRIRDAKLADADDVARLMRLVGTELHPGDHRSRDALEGFLADEGMVLVAEREGVVVGACTLLVKRMNPMDATPGAWLDGLAVDERHRRRGVARALMEEARRRAEAAGCDAIVLHTHEDQAAALALYDELGLTRHGLFLVWPLDRRGGGGSRLG